MGELQALEVSPNKAGAYHTIGAALHALVKLIPDDNVPVTINVAPGEYHERLEIRRPNLTIRGETAESVRIIGDLGAFMDADDGLKLGTFRTYTVFVDAHDVVLENLSIENEAGDGRKVGQAIALYADGDRLVVNNCRLLGHQDTLFCGPLPPTEVKPGGFIGPKQFASRIVGRQYYRRCFIAGDVDFIFGSATAYFESCELHSLDRNEKVNGYITAASTPEAEKYGFVFHGCSFTGSAGEATVYLGRPWRDWAKTVLIDCWLGQHIKPEGWFDWNKSQAREHSFYAGSSLVGPGAVSRSWVPWAHILNKKDVVSYSREHVLAGSDGWDPEGGAGDATEIASLSDSGRTVHVDKYFEDESSFRERFIQEGRSAAFLGKSSSEWLTWRDGARKRLADVLGLSLLKRVSASAQEIEHVRMPGDIIRSKVLIKVEQDVWMPVYMLMPKHPKCAQDGRSICFIAPHGHQGGGAASVAGIMGVPSIDDAIRRFNYDYGLRLAHMGYVVACPEARGWGSRRDAKGQGDSEENYLRGTCAMQAHMAEPLGLSTIGLLTWDLMRLVDYLGERGDISMSSLGCIGFSGGGMQTLYLSALDERISKVFISGYLYGVADSLLSLNGNCSCNYVPGLWKLFDMGDIASLIAPRPLIVQSCENDHLNGPRGLENVSEQVQIVRRAYKLLGKEENLFHEVCPGEHHMCVTHLQADICWLDKQATALLSVV